jgi:hypothetical protein
MTRFATILASAIALASQPCMPEGTLDPKEETGDSDTTGDTQGMGPCESGLCDLTITDAVVECGEGITGDPSEIEASAGVGTVTVHHHRVDMGCCPELAISGIQNLRDDRIEVDYDLYDDVCDCICELDVRYTLTDLYSGSFELTANGDSITVTVD